MWLTLTLAILVVLESFIGIEMVNTPPITKRHKWIWRISFFVLAVGIIGLTCLQNYYSQKDEQGMRTDFSDRLAVLGTNLNRVKIELLSKINEDIPSTALKLSTDTVRLGDGNNSVQTDISVYNPSDFPVSGVVLQFHIVGDGVRADSVNIKMPDEYQISKDWEPDPPGQIKMVVNAYTARIDAMQEPTNQNIVFQIGWIRAKQSRFLDVGGTMVSNSYASIRITSYSTNTIEVLRGSNSFSSYFPVISLPIRAAALGNPPTNIVFFANGVTNYPPEQNGKWIHYRTGYY